MLTTLRHVTLLITSATLIYCFAFFHLEFRRTNVKRFEGGTRIKNVIAYSLRKQIEIEGEEIFCENYTNVGGNPRTSENHVWTKIPNTELFVYSAYVDGRLSPYKYLRIIGMYKGNWKNTVYCQTLESNGSHIVMKSKNTDIWVHKWNKGGENTYNPVLISCQIRPNTRHLTLNGKPCEYVGNHFLLHRKRNLIKPKQRKRVTLCVKPLNFKHDVSDHLVQWIEINKIVGADKIDIYVENVHKNVELVLKWYQKNQSDVNFIRHSSIASTKFKKKDINHIEISSGYTSSLSNVNDGDIKKIITDVTVNESVRKVWQKRRNELISYNDCFYRNLNATDFILPVDIDEIIISKQFYTWGHFLDDILYKNPELGSYASLSVRNAYFFRDPWNKDRTVFFLRDRTRSGFSAKDVSGKSFVSTKNALTVFNHYALHVLRPGLSKVHFLSPDDVQMNHYRETCPMWLLPECKKYFHDTRRFNDASIAKYEEEFNRNYGIILDQLKHIQSVT